MGDVLLYVGENLSYENENIFVKKAEELVNYEGDALCVVCAYHEDALSYPATHGIRDEEFIRGKAPMTKEEVRAVSLAKLGLSKDAVCYDVGAGTGSVSVEMALRAVDGCVYAIEKKEDALEVLAQNKLHFAVDNLEIVAGTAPEAMEALPAPTHAFIGGSSGNLKEIMALLLKKNPQVKMVINCITLETVSEALEAIRTLELTQTDIVQIGASRSKSVGRYHMMMGENPIYVITCRKDGSL
jgi:precorrin-6Y C5,15-methyltransferase (decarboxylating)